MRESDADLLIEQSKGTAAFEEVKSMKKLADQEV